MSPEYGPGMGSPVHDAEGAGELRAEGFEFVLLAVQLDDRGLRDRAVLGHIIEGRVVVHPEVAVPRGLFRGVVDREVLGRLDSDLRLLPVADREGDVVLEGDRPQVVDAIVRTLE